MAMTTTVQEDLRFRNQELNTLFRYSGLEDIFGNFESVLQLSENINEVALVPGHGEFARAIMRRAYSAEKFYRALRTPFNENYKPQHILSAVQWYRSPLGKKILRYENEANNPENQFAMELFAEKLLNTPPGERRISLIEKIERSSGMTEAGKALYVGYVKLMYPFNKNIQGKSLGKFLKIMKENITEPMREIILRGLLYSYKDITDRELEKYAGFLNSGAGRWLSQMTLKGLEMGIKKTFYDAERIQVEIIKEIEAGGPEFPLIKEIAPPGQRYLLIGRRDTFQPLVTGAGGAHSRKDEQKSRVRLFGDELRSIPPIALRVWNKIEDRYPKLYRKLKRFERLFNNREELEELPDDEYAEALEGYRDALEQSSEIKMDESPLQIEYKSLRMTGIIRKKLEAVAMFEVGKTGYAVRKGDLIGPFFGYVDEIQDEQVIVVEKFRDYLGNIRTNQKIIEFFQSPSNEGNKNL